MKEIKWKIFEENATQFLNNLYTEYNFITQGSSDSTAPDIVCEKNNKRLLKIEAKFLPSQSGQIVLIKQENRFIISEQSNNKIIKESHDLVNIINKEFDSYKNTSLSEIKVSNDILYNWVKSMYILKGSEWIIFSKNFKNLTKKNTYLIPIQNLENYCDIKAVLRFKRSGTAYLPKSSEKQFIKESESLLGRIEVKRINNKPIIELENTPSSLYIGDIFYLSEISNNKYLVKKRASTNNLNIIFQLDVKKNIYVCEKNYEIFQKLLDLF